eukprot:COSAG06_NODE_17745_length_923_cov_1.401699_1_plen_70_part_10
MPEMSGSQRRAHIERVRSQQQAAWMEQRRLAADREHVLGTAVAGSTGGGGGGGAGLGSGGGAGLGSGGGG